MSRALATGLFRLVLAFYPAAYRREMGPDVLGLFGDLLREADGWSARWKVVCRGIAGALLGLLPAWMDELEPRARRRRGEGRVGSMVIGNALKAAVRSLSRAPGFGALVVLILAVGTGAATTMISVVDGVLLRALPYPESEELVVFSGGASEPDVRSWRERIGALEEVAGARAGVVSVVAADGAFQARSARVTEGFLQMFEASPVRGRLIESGDYAEQRRVAVLSEGAWERGWGGGDVIGSSVQVDGMPYEVVGVLPYEFTPPERVTGTQVDIWLTVLASDGMLVDPQTQAFSVAGRLRPGASLTDAQAGALRVQHELAAELPQYHLDEDGEVLEFPVESLARATTASIRMPLLVLLSGAGLLLLAACANAAGLFLARGVTRESEWAVRAALGAGRSTVVAGVLAEGLVLAGAAAVLGLVMARLGVSAVHDLTPGLLPRFQEVGIDGRVVFWSVALTFVTAVLFSGLPAWRASRVHPGGALRNSRSGGARATLRLQRLLVVGEVAVTTVLLFAAGLLMRSFGELVDVDLGFDTEDVAFVAVPLGRSTPRDERIQIVQRLTESLQAVPGVESVGGALTTPLEFGGGGRCCFQTRFTIDGVQGPPVWMNPVTDGFFDALSMPLVEGRGLIDADNEATPMPIVLSESYAQALFDGAPALGRQLEMTAAQPTVGVVVGVVADHRHWGPSDEPEPMVFAPWRSQGSWASRFGFSVRTRQLDQATVTALRDAMQQAAPAVAVDLSPLQELMAEQTSRSKFFATLLGFFAVTALSLAAAGLLSALLYQARQRRREVGIRLALGADGGRVARSVLRDALLTVSAGAVLGMIAFPVVGRTIEALLFSVSTNDPWTILGGVGALLLAAALATWVPARIVARTDPAVVLKED